MVNLFNYSQSALTEEPNNKINKQITNNSNYWQIQSCIYHLLNKYLADENLNDRLQDLPSQFKNPSTRPWKHIDWQSINPEQVIGIDIEVFLLLLQGALDTEAPIRGYTQTSRKYLQSLHPQMAEFVGGKVDTNNNLIEPGLWEKEERQHTPALLRVYQQLTTTKITPTLRNVRGYLPTENPQEDLYRHGLHRVATEYGAMCLYIWLMAHSKGALQDVFEQLAIDEINHMSKFWGFGIWAYPDTSLFRVIGVFLKTHDRNNPRNSLFRTLGRMMGTLKWQQWSLVNKASLIFTFAYALMKLLWWNFRLKRQYLCELLGDGVRSETPLQINNQLQKL